MKDFLNIIAHMLCIHFTVQTTHRKSSLKKTKLQERRFRRTSKYLGNKCSFSHRQLYKQNVEHIKKSCETSSVSEGVVKE